MLLLERLGYGEYAPYGFIAIRYHHSRPGDPESIMNDLHRMKVGLVRGRRDLVVGLEGIRQAWYEVRGLDESLTELEEVVFREPRDVAGMVGRAQGNFRVGSLDYFPALVLRSSLIDADRIHASGSGDMNRDLSGVNRVLQICTILMGLSVFSFRAQREEFLRGVIEHHPPHLLRFLMGEEASLHQVPEPQPGGPLYSIHAQPQSFTLVADQEGYGPEKPLPLLHWHPIDSPVPALEILFPSPRRLLRAELGYSLTYVCVIVYR